MHKSIATINSPQFINLQPMEISPLMTKCEIKVLYIGENRNHSYITKEVATEMSKSLRGAPIVGYYNKDEDDFGDHGNKIIIDDEGTIKFECMTKPYGFVAPDAKVWFQTFEDTDVYGNTETREYLMTNGYLWTGQFKEAAAAIQEGRPQSMELDENTLSGRWESNKQSGIDFFIINDATFSKLCILGEGVEPCFEGAKVSAPEVSTSFTCVDDDFKKTLFSMMRDLQFALQGGQQMDVEVKTPETEIEAELEEIQSPEAIQSAEAEIENEVAETAETVEEETPVEVEVEPVEVIEEYSKEEKEEEQEEEKEEEKSDAQEPAEEEKKDEDKEKYALLEQEFSALQEQYSALKVEYEKLVAFKAEVEDKQKDEMIAKFCFLSDEDKKDVIENKSSYSLDEIEAKLSVISVRNRVNFGLLEEEQTENEKPITTFTAVDEGECLAPWIQALKNNQRK